MAWVTVIGILALRSSGKQQPVRASGGYGVWVARLGMAAIFSLPLFAAWSLFDTGIPQPVRIFRLVLTLSSMLVMGTLVFFKQHLLDRELVQLLTDSQESFDNLKRVQAQLVQSEKLASLGQLVGGAAHELNNPLTAMMGYSDLLASTELSSEQRSLMQKIEQQVRRTRTLVSSLLSFAKQVPAEKTLVDINALVQTAVKLCLPQSRGPNVQVHTDFAKELPRVLGDSNQLLQVCLHVTNNALHALTDTGGTLTVTARLQESPVVLEFSDDGPGMEEPDRVFDPFYTTRPVGQGPGLGLSVCYGIIQEHNGKITCQNRPQGGAIFRIELPAVMDGALASGFTELQVARIASRGEGRRDRLGSSEFDSSLQLAAGGVNVAPTRTPNECGHAGSNQYLLKLQHAVLGRSLKCNPRAGVQRNQVHFRSYSADQFTKFASVLRRIVHAVEENIFESQSLPVSQWEITRSRHQLLQVPFAIDRHQPAS